MLDKVGWTLQDFLFYTEDLGLVEEPRPPQFKRQDISVGRKSVRLDSSGWSAADGKLCLKYARIRGAAMDIATVMAYPTVSPDKLPVFAAEWVVFGDRCHAVILDVEVCGHQAELMNRLERHLESVANAWRPQFPENRDRPQWFDEIASPWAIYGACDADRLPEIRSAFNDYLEVCVDNVYKPALPESEGGGDHPAVRAYKHHHFVNSPGHRLLGVKLGQSQTDELLREWHFGPHVAANRERVEVKSGRNQSNDQELRR